LLIFSAGSVAAQTNRGVLSKQDYDHTNQQPGSRTADPTIGPPAFSTIPPLAPFAASASATADARVRCQSVWIESADPWIKSRELVGRVLTIPDFVNSRISVSADAKDADLAIRLEPETEDDGSRLAVLTVSSLANINISDRIAFKWPGEDYEEAIAEKAVALLLSHCTAPDNDTQPDAPLPSELVKEKLSAARIMKPIVHTSWMREKVLSAALEARPEFVDWGIQIAKSNQHADVDLVVGHILSTLTWTFKLADHDTGSLLDSGTVIAFTDDHAATMIVAAAVKRIAVRRPLRRPSRSLAVPLSTSREVDYQWPPETVVYENPTNPETWEIKALSEDMNKRFPEKMQLSIRDGNVVAHDLSGRTLFSIPGSNILDFADTKSHMSLGDYIRLDDDDWNGCSEGCPGVFLYVPILVVLDGVRINQHIFEIAWTENGTVHVASLQMTKGDYNGLLSELDFLMLR